MTDGAAPVPEGLARPGFGEALRYWTVLGWINFGGPAGQIAMLHRDLVTRRRWISEESFFHALNFCMFLPGPEATQLAIYVGWLLHGAAGGILAGVLFVLPSILLLLALSWTYAAHGSVPAVAAVLAGLKPVVVAIVLAAVWRIGRRALRRPAHAAIAAGAFAALLFHVPFPAVILAAGALGALGLLSPAASGDAAAAGAPAARASTGRRNARLVGTFAVLWAAPLAAISLALGWNGLHARAYRFFTQAAFVTFGGAYAVLAYVVQATVDAYHWITPAQAVDGLALAETTPGPLIMVLQFVGYLAGWNDPGGLSRGAAGTLGAAVATWTTFLPCFFFILIGAPYVERLRGNRRLAGALSGITAAVVGVILSLALFFARAALFPRGFAAGPDAFGLLLAAAALAALVLFDLDTPWVVVGGGLAGLLARLLLRI